MRDVFEKIQELQSIPSNSKHEQIVNGILNAINEKLILQGDMLPSVNVMIRETGYARETIAKAYTHLKDKGIIASKNRLGYYVANNDTEQQIKVALLMYGYDTFQEIFYTNFREELGERVHLNVYFHHNNIEIFETIIDHIKGSYGMYVVSPIPHPKTPELLKNIPLNKFLMFDRFEQLEGEYSFVTQEFEHSAYKAFSQLSGAIKKFDEILFCYKPSSVIPIEILKGFKKFLKDYDINGQTQHGYKYGEIQTGKVYFTMDNAELFALIKECKEKKLIIGSDIGILSHNDEPVKEIVGDGITTFSTDFAEMGRKAAKFVLTRDKIQEVIPTVLIRRNSL
jgi:DNA-binding transcriptional regulator YhcF (GntR family)